MRGSRYDRIGWVERVILRVMDGVVWVVDLFRRKS
jgi:hypothetical protein